MSVSLQEVLESAGYDVKNNYEDALWLLGQRNEFDELCEEAEGFVERKEEEEDESQF